MIPAPNRSIEAAAVVNQHRHLLGTDDSRRLILPYICAALNVVDDGQWGLLEKQERTPPFIPSDIIVWKPTMEHIDVMTGDGPVWINYGPVLNPRWVWVDADRMSPAEPTPAPEPIEDAAFTARVHLLETRATLLWEVYAELAKQLGTINQQTAALDRDVVKKPLPDYIAQRWGFTIVSRPRG